MSCVIQSSRHGPDNSCLCQVVTVNDYLARRDSEWVGQVHKFLGLQVGLIQQSLSVRHTGSRMLLWPAYQIQLVTCTGASFKTMQATMQHAVKNLSSS